MQFEKANFQVNGNQINLSMGFSKVDAENRLVSGWATLDNVDQQGDVVVADASQRAFSRFRSNIREMHQPIAVGKMLSFQEQAFYDANTDQFFNGIYVTVYVSKGAPDTWEKVLDGTLSGFSIGGEILDSETLVMNGETIRVIKDYELVELSLVDSPANQLANVISVTKMDDGARVLKGMMAETTVENVFWCPTDEIAKTSTEDSLVCTNCDSKMENIGWFESGPENTQKVREIVSKFRGETSSASVEETEAEIAKQANPANNEGGVNVAGETKETVEKSEEVVETPTDETVEKNNEVVEPTEEEATTEKAADVSEVGDEPDFAKMFGDLQSAITSGLEKNSREARAAIDEVTQKFEARFEELHKSHTELNNRFQSLKDNLDEVEKSVKVIEDETAVKKSGDLGGSSEETLEKSNKGSKWGGHFLNTTDLQ